MMIKVDLSIIIPVYNGARFIKEALDSVVDQTVSCREIIVVDDGSLDKTADIVRDFPHVQYIYKPHSGISETLNLGIENAAGDYIAFLDADDRWLKHKTELQMAALNRNPDIDMVFGQCRQFLMTENGEEYLDDRSGITKVGGLFRQSAFQTVGLFQSRHADFIEWFIRAIEIGLNYEITNDVVFERRIHGANTGILERESQRRGYHHILKMKLDRMRK